MRYTHDAANLRSLLQPYMDQISSLHISFFKAKKLELLLKDLPALQELTIRAQLVDEMPDIAQTISRLPSTLRSLSVTQPLFDIERLSSFHPIWNYLTHVEINIGQPDAFFHLLQLCPNLSWLRTILIIDTTPALKSFTHTKLHHMSISVINARGTPPFSDQLPDLFNALSLPNLRVLEVHYMQRWPHEELKTFLARSNCPLESLILGNQVKTTEEQQAEYIALVPSLEVHSMSFAGWF